MPMNLARSAAFALTFALTLAFGAAAAHAQDVIKIAGVYELSGAGASAGTYFIPDHNGIKGYMGVYSMKAAIEKAGKLDRKAVAEAMHGLVVHKSKNPGIIMDVRFDDKGDIDRDSFLVEVKGGKQVVVSTLPPLQPIK